MVAKLTASEYLAQFSPDSAAAFKALRKAVMQSGPLDPRTCELITLGALASARIEVSFKVHARRLLDDGVPPAALRQAVLVTFAASSAFGDIVNALHWIDEACAPG